MSTSPYAPPLYPAAPAQRNPLGMVSLGAGIGLLVWSLAFVVLQAAAIGSSGGTPQLAMLGLLNGFVVFVLAAVGLTCGIIGLVTRDRPRIAAGIGTGIAAAELIAVASGSLFSVLIPLFGG